MVQLGCLDKNSCSYMSAVEAAWFYHVLYLLILRKSCCETLLNVCSCTMPSFGSCPQCCCSMERTQNVAISRFILRYPKNAAVRTHPGCTDKTPESCTIDSQRSFFLCATCTIGILRPPLRALRTSAKLSRHFSFELLEPEILCVCNCL